VARCKNHQTIGAHFFTMKLSFAALIVLFGLAKASLRGSTNRRKMELAESSPGVHFNAARSELTESSSIDTLPSSVQPDTYDNVKHTVAVLEDKLDLTEHDILWELLLQHGQTHRSKESDHRMLLPGMMQLNLWEYMMAVDSQLSPVYSKIMSLMVAAGMEDELRDAVGTTLFAPDNSAITAEQEAFLLDPANEDVLVRTMKYHVVPSIFSYLKINGDFGAQIDAIITASGDTIDVMVTATGVMVNGQTRAVSFTLAEQSILYRIDKVLIPPALDGVLPKGFLLNTAIQLLGGEFELPVVVPDAFGSDDYETMESDFPSIVPAWSPAIESEEAIFPVAEAASSGPTKATTGIASDSPSTEPSDTPSSVPSDSPSPVPSDAPSSVPSDALSFTPSSVPSDYPSSSPSINPSSELLDKEGAEGTIFSDAPSFVPSDAPSAVPSDSPSAVPSEVPSHVPSDAPSLVTSDAPSQVPSDSPSMVPSDAPSTVSNEPSNLPSGAPSTMPSRVPTGIPSLLASDFPSTTFRVAEDGVEHTLEDVFVDTETLGYKEDERRELFSLFSDGLQVFGSSRSPNRDITFFLPHRLDDVDEDYGVDFKNPAYNLHLLSLVRFHIANGLLAAAEFKQEDDIEMLSGGKAHFVVQGNEAVAIDSFATEPAAIVSSTEAMNFGMIHVVDRVLVPQWMTLNVMTLMETYDELACPKYSKFRSLIAAADLDGILREIEDVTVFAPQNDAISQELVDYLLLPSSKFLVANVVSYHVISDAIVSHLEVKAAQDSTMKFPTFQSSEITLSVRDDSMFVNNDVKALAVALARRAILYRIDSLLVPTTVQDLMPVTESAMVSENATDSELISSALEQPVLFPSNRAVLSVFNERRKGGFSFN
jgi:uncharacterized surface protein with fasciclin (FAS1) repeats